MRCMKYSLMGNGLLTFIHDKTYYSNFFSNDEIIFYNNLSNLSDKKLSIKRSKGEYDLEDFVKESEEILCEAIDNNGIFVTENGDDSNDGLSPGTAKRTVGGATSVAVAGNNIRVAAGIYQENNRQKPAVRNGTLKKPSGIHNMGMRLTSSVRGEFTSFPR